MAVDATAAAGSSAATASTETKQGLEAMDGMSFLNLLISELSNQDPFEPMNNKEILEQLSSIRNLESNMTMTESFKDLLAGQKDQTEATQTMSELFQQFAAGQQLLGVTSLVGRVVAGIDTAGEVVEGKVDRVILDGQGVRLQIGDREVKLENMLSISADDAA